MSKVSTNCGLKEKRDPMRELTKPELPNLYQRQTKVAIDSNGRQLQKARLCGKYDVVEYFSHSLYI